VYFQTLYQVLIGLRQRTVRSQEVTKDTGFSRDSTTIAPFKPAFVKSIREQIDVTYETL